MEKLNGRITISLLVVLISIGLAGLEGQAFAQESPEHLEAAVGVI